MYKVQCDTCGLSINSEFDYICPDFTTKKHKPPLGVIREFNFERERILDLTRALHVYVEDYRQDEHLIVWVDELKERLIKWNSMENKIKE